MKNLIIFNINKNSEFVINAFDNLKNNINNELYDIVVQCQNSCNFNYSNLLKYNGTLNSSMACTKIYELPNLIKPLYDDYLINKSKYQNYKHFYIINYSVYCNKPWNELFSLIDNKVNDSIDLLMNELRFYEDDSWMWTKIYKSDNEIIKDDNFKRLLGSYNGGFIRISKNALEFYANYNKTNIKDYFIDFSLPTILYNYGFNLKSLSWVSDNEFNLFNICKKDTFSYGVKTMPKKEMNSKYSDITLFSNYNESIGIEYEHKIKDPIIGTIVYYNDKNNDLNLVKNSLYKLINYKSIYNREIIFIDDSSNDKLKNFILENNLHKEDKLIYIKVSNYGIVNAINHGIYNTEAKYVHFLNAYDIIDETLLDNIFNLMILKNYNCLYNLNNLNILDDNNELLNYNLLYDNNYNDYQNLYIKKEILINELLYMFEEYYVNNFTRTLLINLLSSNINVNIINYKSVNIHNILYYDEFADLDNVAYIRTKNLINFLTNNDFKESKNLTVIVSFKNEGREIEKTLSSIRATTSNLPIILLNDGSTDNINYYKIAKKYKVRYLENTISSGVAGARENAIALINTDYFMILDGHMRFYENNWDDRILNILKDGKYDNDILCAQTRCFWIKNKLLYDNEIGKDNSTCYGATLNDDSYTNSPYWTWKCYDESMKNDNIVMIPCILGACYIINKNHWTRIGGLTGLLQWGQDEPLLSIKTWLSGNKCYVIRDFYAGHLYRDATPYHRNSAEMNSNYIYLNHLFYEGDKLKEKLDKLKKYLSEDGFNEANKIFNNRINEFNKFKLYFDNFVKVHPIEYFEEINLKCK